MKRIRQALRQSPLVLFGGTVFLAGLVLGASASAWIGARASSQDRAALAESQGRELALTDLMRTLVDARDSGASVAGLAAPLSAPAMASDPLPSAPAATAQTVAPDDEKHQQTIAKAEASKKIPSASVPQSPKPQLARASIAERPPRGASTAGATNSAVTVAATQASSPQQEPSPRPAPSSIATTTTTAPVVTTAATTQAATPANASALRPSTGPLEAVSAAKAEVAGLDRGWVRMNSGQVIRVNEKFPSGETLLSVDPIKNQIVTDRRVLLIL